MNMTMIMMIVMMIMMIMIITMVMMFEIMMILMMIRLLTAGTDQFQGCSAQKGVAGDPITLNVIRLNWRLFSISLRLKP